MTSVFYLTTKNVQSLSDEPARELVARLCREELRKKGLSQEAVKWGGDQRAADGGIDVRVTIPPPAPIDGYIKSAQTGFQVKSERFPAAKVKAEMMPKPEEVLRPSITELADLGGAYIIVSTKDNLTDTTLASRIKQMRACVREHDLDDRIILDFYDARRVADWIEQHPPIANWVRWILGKPIDGWWPYGAWAYDESDATTEYLIDDEVRVFTPDESEGVDILAAIDQLRSELTEKTSVRLVGLSGTGKTRLVQALFDKRIETENSALEDERVFYTDVSDNPTPQPDEMLRVLVEEKSECIVVVDNCGAELHGKLTAIAKDTQVHVITIEYDIQDDLHEGTSYYRLEGVSAEIIEKLLHRRYSFLSDTDLATIAAFSEGNARVAFALASTAQTTGELARLRDKELFKRLFQQRNESDTELMRCAEAASLLYSFDGEDSSDESEMKLLAGIAEVSVLTFSRHIAELQRRGLAQKRSKWRAILPHAISNRLAANALEYVPKGLLLSQFNEKATDRVARSFSRRLGYLHESPDAREIVQGWLQPGGRYSDVRSLDGAGFQIFANIAPVQQQAALDALDRASHDPDFISTANYLRSHYIRIIGQLAYDPNLFDQATAVLIRAALVEPQGHNHAPARDMLQSLCHCLLSGTQAPPHQRVAIVRPLILSGREDEQRLGLVLLKAGLKSSHFMGHSDYDFGARKRSYGWRPRSMEDIQSWYGSFLEVAIESGSRNTSIGREVRHALGESMDGPCIRARLTAELIEAVDSLAAVDGWAEGWISVRGILRGEKEGIDSEMLDQLRTLESKLAPADLKGIIRARVLVRGTPLYDLEEEGDETEISLSRTARISQQAEALGREAARDIELLAEILPEVLQATSSYGIFNFGYGIGVEIQDAGNLFSRAREIIAARGTVNTSLVAMRGVLRAWQQRDPDGVSRFLDCAVSDDVWSLWFPELQTQVDLNEAAYRRLLQALALGRAPAGQYSYLSLGCATSTLTPSQSKEIIARIAEIQEFGLITAIHLLSMVISCSTKRDDEYRSELSGVCLSFITTLNWSALESMGRTIDHDIDEVLERALSVPASVGDVEAILKSLMEAENSERHRYDPVQERFLGPFLVYYPQQALDAVYLYRRRAVRSRVYVGSEIDRGSLGQVSTDALIEWCEKSPTDRYEFAAHNCRFLVKSSEEGDTDPALSEAVIQIMLRCENKVDVLRIFLDRLHPWSFSGKLSVILKRRLPLIALLNPSENADLAVEVAQAEERFRKRIAVAEAEEQEESRERLTSFE